MHAQIIDNHSVHSWRALLRQVSASPATVTRVPGFAAASAALGIFHRCGFGKMRQLDINSFWIQQAAHRKMSDYAKFLGTQNPADMLAKHSPEEPRLRHANRLAVEYMPGRPEPAPRLCSDELSNVEVIKPDKPLFPSGPA